MAATRLMYAGAVVTALYAILGFPPYARLSRLATNHPYTIAQHAAYDAASVVLAFIIVAGFLGIAGWLISAQVVSRGRRWGATLGTVLFGIDTLVALVVLADVHVTPGPKAMGVVVWVIGLVATILMWGREPRAFYRAFR
jgi:hypothetical protein